MKKFWLSEADMTILEEINKKLKDFHLILYKHIKNYCSVLETYYMFYFHPWKFIMWPILFFQCVKYNTYFSNKNKT